MTRASAPAYSFENAFAAFESRDFGLGQDLDIRLRFDPLNKVAGHGPFQTFATCQEPHLLYLAREIDGGLSRRITRADERHFLPAAKPRLDRRGPVMHA